MKSNLKWPECAIEMLRLTNEELNVLENKGVEGWESLYSTVYPGYSYKEVLIAQKKRLEIELKDVKK